MIGDNPKLVIASDSYVLQGKSFNIVRRFSLTDSEILYMILDSTTLSTEKRLLLLPFMFKTSGGLVFIDFYQIESYTGGTELPFARLNSRIENSPETIFKYGVTPIGDPGDEKLEYIVGVSGTKYSGGGEDPNASIREINVGEIYVLKIANQEEESIIFNLGLIICEI